MVETSLMVPGTPPRSDYRVPRRPKPGVLERLPIVRFPSRRQNLRLAFGKAGMVKYDLGSGTLRHELKFRNRVDAGEPSRRFARRARFPVRCKFDVRSPTGF